MAARAAFAHRSDARRSGKTEQHRRVMIAKINIGWKQLRMDEADYRAALAEVTGHASLKACSEAQLARMLDWLASKGFRPVQANGAATHPMARKARALWISLYHLGAVDNPSEQALEAFAKRQLKCEKLVWADQRQSYQLIEALKAWAVRAGWPEAGNNSAKAGPLALQVTLCGAILAKLKAAGIAKPGWDLMGTSMQLLGRTPGSSTGEPMTVADWQQLAEVLGKILNNRSNGSSKVD
jgi:phage gp16-like protein